MAGPRHHGHGHGITRPRDADSRWLAAAGALIVAFMCGEVVAGVITHSLTLLCHAVRADLEALLARNGITHATLQVDHVPTAQGAEHAPDTADPAHCEDSHGPSYRPGQPL